MIRLQRPGTSTAGRRIDYFVVLLMMRPPVGLD